MAQDKILNVDLLMIQEAKKKKKDFYGEYDAIVCKTILLDSVHNGSVSSMIQNSNFGAEE